MLSTIRDYRDRETLDIIRGANVYGADHEKLGSAEDAIVDVDSGELRYLIVNAGWLKDRRFAVPADQVYTYGDNDDLFVNLSKAEAEALPAYDDACLSSEDAFTNYEREFQSAWRPGNNPSAQRPSERLLRLRNRIQQSDSAARLRTVGEKRHPGTLTEASYSGNTMHPTGVYGVYSDRKDVESTVSALQGAGFPSTNVSVVFPSQT